MTKIIFRIAAVTSLLLSGSQMGFSQGTFQNLDFEGPIPPLIPDPIGLVPISNALPGWTGYLTGVPTDRVFYPHVALGSPSISVVDQQSGTHQPIQGSYSVFLNSAAIGQAGQVPGDALSILFLRTPQSGFQVSFAGQNIPLVQLGSSGDNVIMAGDISMFAGQTGELRFGGAGLFDNIQFSPSAIPEPGALAVGLLGAIVWLRWLKRHKRTRPAKFDLVL